MIPEGSKEKIIFQLKKLLESNEYHNWLLALQIMRGQKITKDVLGFELTMQENLMKASGFINPISLNFLGKLIEKHFQDKEQDEQSLRKLLLHIKEIFKLIAQQSPTPKINFTIHISNDAYLIENHCPVRYHFFKPDKKSWLGIWQKNQNFEENWWENTDYSTSLPQKLLRSTFISIERN